ncbi:MAG: inner membrane-spanning protein YciB [Gammaproteobacteria bacterium]
MQHLFVYLPIVLFFGAYQLSDIYIATMVLMASTTILLGVERLTTGSVKKAHLYITGLLLVLGTITILVRDPKFIQWKMTIVFWIFSGILLFSQLRGKKPTIQALLEMALTEVGEEDDDPLTLTDPQWRGLNLSWALFFLAVGAINLFVAYTYSEAFWIKFKVFGVFGLQFAFLLISMFWLFSTSARNNKLEGTPDE